MSWYPLVGIHLLSNLYSSFLFVLWVEILHTDNTRPSRRCVIQEYQLYTIRVKVYTMSQSVYQESKSIPWVKAFTVSITIDPNLHREFLSLQQVQVHTMRQRFYIASIYQKVAIKGQGIQRVDNGSRYSKVPKGPRYPNGKYMFNVSKMYWSSKVFKRYLNIQDIQEVPKGHRLHQEGFAFRLDSE